MLPSGRQQSSLRLVMMLLSAMEKILSMMYVKSKLPMQVRILFQLDLFVTFKALFKEKTSENICKTTRPSGKALHTLSSAITKESDHNLFGYKS